MSNKMFRHGDLLIEETREHTSLWGNSPKEVKDKVLALGEATGHKHQIKGKATVLSTDGKDRFIRVNGPAVLVHEEHKEIKLPVGFYRVRFQREYDPLTQTRQVMD